jgi:hypothetical protein
MFWQARVTRKNKTDQPEQLQSVTIKQVKDRLAVRFVMRSGAFFDLDTEMPRFYEGDEVNIHMNNFIDVSIKMPWYGRRSTAMIDWPEQLQSVTMKQMNDSFIVRLTMKSGTFIETDTPWMPRWESEEVSLCVKDHVQIDILTMDVEQ